MVANEYIIIRDGELYHWGPKVNAGVFDDIRIQMVRSLQEN